MNRAILLVCCLACFLALGVGILWLRKGIPYGFEHRREIEAMNLASLVSGWKASGKPPEALYATNNGVNGYRIFSFRTNLAISGRSIRTIVAVRKAVFQGKGFLVASEDPTVVWLGSQGDTKLMYPRTEQETPVQAQPH